MRWTTPGVRVPAFPSDGEAESRQKSFHQLQMQSTTSVLRRATALHTGRRVIVAITNTSMGKGGAMLSAKTY